MALRVCLIEQDSNESTLVELPHRPDIGSLMMVSPTEVIRGPQPKGQLITAYIPDRTLIKITVSLGWQEHFDDRFPTYKYIPGSWV